MSRRKKIIIIVAVLLGVLALAVLLISLSGKAPLFLINESEPPVVQGSGENLGGRENVAAPGAGGTDILTESPSTQSTLIAIAMTFAERFGSFSNEGNYENLTDLKAIMTDNMKRWTDNYIASNNVDLENFYGVTTRALSAEIITLADDERQAQVVVSTQRQELAGEAKQARVYYQKILLNLTQGGDGWKVDGATWQ